MKFNHKKYQYIGFLLSLMTVLSSCVDEFDRMEQEPYIEGIADIAVDLTYEAESSRPLTTRSYEGGAEGNAISNITSLVMLVYDGDDLFKKYDIIGGTPDPDITEVINHNDNNIETGEPDSPTDDKTGKVTFRLKIASGKNYRIYAVANMGDLSEYAEAIKTRDGLKNISRKWIPESLADNSEMFGVFSIQPDRKANDDNSIVVSARTSVLHCWVRRLASKVSVAFDGTELYDNVRVYVTDIYLKDIPRYCYLGRDNVPGIDSEGKEMSRDARYSDQIGGLWEDGGKITVQILPADLSTVDEKTHIHLCNNEHSYLGAYSNSNDPSVVDKTHENKAPALFFYENMQGEGKSKKQDAHNNNHPENETPDNKIDYPNPDESKPGSGWKDEKAYGSYVEVKGFYYCKMPDGHVSSGPITYRFMLGQDVDKNYDATRNTHYQLTLAFKGYGNDADWHIDYQEERGMYATTPQYISYLYNKKMVTTVKVVGKMKPGSKLKAEIVEAAGETYWRPWGDGSEEFPLIDDKTMSAEWPSVNQFYTGTVEGEGAHQAFLSLRQTKLTVIPPQDEYKGKPSWEYPFEKALKRSQDYYLGKSGLDNNSNPIGSREYEIGVDTSDLLQSFGGNGDAEDGIHTVIVSKRNTDGEAIERVFKIPLYTRAKEIVTRTGFTGNNPYYSYPRKQKVKFTASIWDETKGDYIEESFYVDIIQVRRIINPKGVWRKSGSTKGFHVRLYRLLADNDASNFSDFKSEGTWSAEILTDPNNIISLSSTKEGSGDEVAPQVFVKRVQGSDRAPIDFNINFNGIDGCAIIRVRYHDYTCEHDIFCREGYDPIPLGKNGTKWSSFNVDHFETDPDDTTKKIAVMTKSPLDEGSLFRRKSYIAITSSNNAKYPRPRGDNRYEPGDLDIIDETGKSGTLPWSSLKGSWTKDSDHVWEVDNSDYKIASVENFYDLVAPDNDRSFSINKAYGIIYGDESTEPKTTRLDAYGYTKTDKDRGMVGVIVYDSKDASQIFFPLGTEGCGRRKGGGKPDDETQTNRDYSGTLRYATRSAWYGYRSSDKTNIKYQPMFYDLYRRPGAVYWCDKWYKDGDNGSAHSSAFDMNFFTMGFEGFQNGAAQDADTSDACFLRLVTTVH